MPNLGYTPGSGALIATDTVVRDGGQTEHVQWSGAPGYSILNITDASVHSVAAKYVVGVVNNSSATQSATITGWDNVSAASGTIVFPIGLMGPNQVVSFPAPGLPLANGLTVQASAIPGGSGIQVLWR